MMSPIIERQAMNISRRRFTLGLTGCCRVRWRRPGILPSISVTARSADRDVVMTGDESIMGYFDAVRRLRRDVRKKPTPLLERLFFRTLLARRQFGERNNVDILGLCNAAAEGIRPLTPSLRMRGNPGRFRAAKFYRRPGSIPAHWHYLRSF